MMSLIKFEGPPDVWGDSGEVSFDSSILTLYVLRVDLIVQFTKDAGWGHLEGIVFSVKLCVSVSQW
jgi:hypothetical protein